MQAQQKIREHYGLTLPLSSIRRITEKHGAVLLENRQLETGLPEKSEESVLVAEMDGSMIPIVETTDKDEAGRSIDRRKTRMLFWKEARLSLAINHRTQKKFYEAAIGDADTAGEHMAHCAIQLGAGQNTRIHAVGDGAFWIEEQMERIFGDRSEYLIDFYHLCEYLAAAAPYCDPKRSMTWLTDQKEKLKHCQVDEVIQELRRTLDSHPDWKSDNPVSKCYQYLISRAGQFNYKAAISAGLPIGSGEVESAHRYIIQDRLKLAGAWWSKNNAQSMLALRTTRANRKWERYWHEKMFEREKQAA